MPSIRDAWVTGDNAVASWFGLRVDRAGDRRQAVDAAGRLDASIASELRAQNVSLPRSAARLRALEAVDAHDVAFVVTGQQLGYLGGPLYSLHKAAAAIALARRLTAETGRAVVPLFWMQTEDHDFAEIAECRLIDARGGAHTLAMAPDAFPERASVAHRHLVADVDRDRIGAILRGLGNADEVTALLSRAFAGGRSLVDAWTELLGGVFGDSELLVFNPRNAAAARLAAPIHRWAIDAAASIEAALTAQSKLIEDAGFGTQIAHRPGVALSNVHPDGIDGARWRLQRAGDSWVAAGSGATVAHSALTDWLEHEPLRLSTSALLRPLVQDAILPAAAYVGGPGELAYLAQIGPLYTLAGVRRAMVVARPTLTWIPSSVAATLREFGVTPRDLAGGIDAVVAQTTAGREAAAAASAINARLVMAFEQALDGEPLLTSSATLAAQAGKARAAVRQSVEKLTERVARELAAQPDGPVERLRECARWLYPTGHAQERTVGFATFAAITGIGGWARRAIQAADPVDTSERYLEIGG
jgi:bacillithiol biosynthesis cysteine-adding enzyme BshC